MAKSRTQKREEANARNEAWAKLTLKQQLSSLDKRGLGAKKQREKIQKRLDEEKKARFVKAHEKFSQDVAS